MRQGSRSERRHHVERLKKFRKHYWGFPLRWTERPGEKPVSPVEMSPEQLGKVVQYPQACSCACCCNVRRAPNINAGERTMQERQHFANYKEQLEELEE